MTFEQLEVHMFGLIVSGILFLLVMAFFVYWQPTRALLKEIIFNPLNDSTFRIVRNGRKSRNGERQNGDEKLADAARI
jgi:hypothetical protein